jgi:SAM-dependent methyltransferase
VLVESLTGTVLELGCGDGRTFAHYPDSVDRVLAVEPEPHLRELAARAALGAPVAVEVIAGSAEKLPFDDASIDAAVCSLVLCSVPDEATALAELRRVVRPGGQLRFYEHVVARSRAGAHAQRFADRSRFWPTIAAGCHCSRDTGAAITAAGFEIQASERFTFPKQHAGLPHILGRAVRP